MKEFQYGKEPGMQEIISWGINLSGDLRKCHNYTT